MALFRDGSLRILVSCRCLDEGIDVPDANIGIVLSSSAVERQRIQRLGRVIRRSPGKDAACLYYFYIRESSDNRAFLPDFHGHRCFDLRYWTEDRDFSNDLYEYASAELIRAAKEGGMDASALGELRLCLMKGLPRADYLLAPEAQQKNIREAGSIRERNYWKAMRRIGAYFDEANG
jgi:hypothetical protein